MYIDRRRPFARSLERYLIALLSASALLPSAAFAQGLTGAVIGTIKDDQGGAIRGAVVGLSSPALIAGPATQATDERGQLRFPALPLGEYVLDVTIPGFATWHEEGLRIGGRHAGAKVRLEASRARAIGRR